MVTGMIGTTSEEIAGFVTVPDTSGRSALDGRAESITVLDVGGSRADCGIVLNHVRYGAVTDCGIVLHLQFCRLVRAYRKVAARSRVASSDSWGCNRKVSTGNGC